MRDLIKSWRNNIHLEMSPITEVRNIVGDLDASVGEVALRGLAGQQTQADSSGRALSNAVSVKWLTQGEGPDDCEVMSSPVRGLW